MSPSLTENVHVLKYETVSNRLQELGNTGGTILAPPGWYWRRKDMIAFNFVGDINVVLL